MLESGDDVMEYYTFSTGRAFENWMQDNYLSDEGIWIRFDKWKKTSTLTSKDGLLIALSYGWIDGLIKRLDEQYYIKYFKKRGKHSIWSSLNKSYAEELIERGLMKPSGIKAVLDAKNDGRWDHADLPPSDYSIDAFKALLIPYEKAYQSYMSFSPSIQKTYALSYYALKKQSSKDKRLEVIKDRLEKGLKPM